MEQIKIYINTSNKRQLAKKYGVPYKNFNSWIKDLPELYIQRWNLLLPPKHVKTIVEYLRDKNKLPVISD